MENSSHNSVCGRNSLRILVTTSEEPIVLNDFVSSILETKRQQVIGVGIVGKISFFPNVLRTRKQKKGSILDQSLYSIKTKSTLHKVNAKLQNALALLFIFGIKNSVQKLWAILRFQIVIDMPFLSRKTNPKSVETVARGLGIPVRKASYVNDPDLLEWIKSLRPDLIINQARGILRDEFLHIPRVGVLNRHNALLPKNRGRFSTFWALYKREQFTGVSIHFVTKDLDAGPIVAQRRVKISSDETVKSLAEKCYAIAPSVMMEAIQNLEKSHFELIPNQDSEATYNSNPTLSQAFAYRWHQIRKTFRVAGTCRL